MSGESVASQKLLKIKIWYKLLWNSPYTWTTKVGLYLRVPKNYGPKTDFERFGEHPSGVWTRRWPEMTITFSLQKGFGEVSKRFQEEQKNMNDLVQKAQQIKDALAGMD